MIPAIVFLLGVFLGAALNALWEDVMELLDIWREER